MRAAVVAFVTAVAFVVTATAGPRRVLVLPLDGNTPAAQKAQIDASVARLAKARIAGDVTIGDTTFTETAAAVGCDPRAPTCVETVRATLGVDELVYGSANTANGTTTVTVRRAVKDASPTERTATLAETDRGDQIEAGLSPAFGDSGSAAGSDIGPPAERGRPASNFFDTRERKLGVGLAAGGVIALAIGVSFWYGERDLQDRIDNHPTRTLADLQDLARLEDRAGDKALWGNLMAALGLGLGATGAYFLYEDHEHRTARIAPAPIGVGSGVAVVVSGTW